MVDFSQATQDLATSLDNLHDSIGTTIDNLSQSIDALASQGASGAGDVTGLDSGISDGAVVKMQYAINEMQKAAESGASTFTKAEQISLKVHSQVQQA